RRGRSPGRNVRAFASKSCSAWTHVSCSTSSAAAIDAIESTSDSRNCASLVNSSSAASWRRRSVTIRYVAKRAPSATAQASPAHVTTASPVANPTTATIAATQKSTASRPALVDDRFAKRNRNGLRPRVRLELGEDVAHVALDGLLADEELRCHVLVRHPVGEQLQDLALAARQHVVLVLAGQERGHQRRIDVALARRDLLDRAQERLVRRLLEDVALRPRLETTAQ